MTSHIRSLVSHDTFGGSIGSGSTADFEALLEADPDVLLFPSGIQPGISTNGLRMTLESNPVAAEISTVQNGRIYPQGARCQGPILNPFQLEMSTKQFYPEAFGERPTSDSSPYPEIPEDEQLFNHQYVTDVTNGEFRAVSPPLFRPTTDRERVVR